MRREIEDVVKRHDIKIKDKPLRVSVELSPERRAKFAAMFRAENYVKTRNIKVETCSKAFTIYSSAGSLPLGAVRRGATDWEWNTANCATVGLNTSEWE